MDNISEKIKTFKYTLKKKKYSIKISIKNNFINFFIEEIDSIPPMKYEKNYSDENLKNLSKYFLMFDSIVESFSDIEKLMNNGAYEFNEDDNLIIIYFKTGITNKNFKFEIPIKKIKIDERLEELTQIIKNQQNEINLLKQIQSVQEYNKLLDKCNKLEKLIIFNNENIFKDFNDSILLEYRQKNIIIDKLKQYYFNRQIFSIALIKGEIYKESNKNFFNYLFYKNDKNINLIEELLVKFFSKYDSNRCTILTKLLYTASINGDNIENFKKNCGNQGSTIIIIKTDQGKTFAAFNDKNFEGIYFNYIMDKIEEDCLIISLDTGESFPAKKYYNDKHCFFEYEEPKEIKVINFGDRLIISDSCLSNQYSSFFGEHFKVLDYEVFSIYLKLFN